jgi:hypothetical protein
MYCRLVFLGEEKKYEFRCKLFIQFLLSKNYGFLGKKSDSYSLGAKLELDKGLNIETASKKNYKVGK